MCFFIILTLVNYQIVLDTEVFYSCAWNLPVKMLDKQENDLPINAVMILEFPQEPQGLKTESTPSMKSAVVVEASSAKTPHASQLRNLFNFNTEEILKRTILSTIPDTKISFYERYIKLKPDLYGPFWTCITLALVLSVVSSLLGYLSLRREGRLPWKYDFSDLTHACLLVFLYSWIVPLALWAVVKWYQLALHRISLVDMICVFGYSLVIYVPATILCLMRNTYFQSGVMVSAAVVSSLLPLSLVKHLILRKKESTIVILCLNVVFTFIMYLMFINK